MKKIWVILFIAALYMLLGSAGCRSVGYSGFEELTYEEQMELTGYAAGIMSKARVKKNNKVVPTSAARNFIRNSLPVVRIDYSDDCFGTASFTWHYEGWQYRVYCQGKLDGSFSAIDWCIAVAPPVTAQEGTARIWDGPSPDLLELQMLHNKGVQLLPDPEGKLEYSFEEEELRDSVVIEGAILQDVE